MASASSVKPIVALEGDTPEEIAWTLMQWIRRVEEAGERSNLLSAYQQCIAATKEGSWVNESRVRQSATNLQLRYAFKLTELVALAEGRDPGQRNQGDRTWILETFVQCLAAVIGHITIDTIPDENEDKA